MSKRKRSTSKDTPPAEPAETPESDPTVHVTSDMLAGSPDIFDALDWPFLARREDVWAAREHVGGDVDGRVAFRGLSGFGRGRVLRGGSLALAHWASSLYSNRSLRGAARRRARARAGDERGSGKRPGSRPTRHGCP